MRPHPDIVGVFVRDLRWHTDDRGSLAELWRESWECVEGSECEASVAGWTGRPEDLGTARQVYATETRPGVVKAWHFHERQTDRFVVLRGVVRLVLVDNRGNSTTRENVVEIVIDADRNPLLVVIPPGVVHGWKCVGLEDALVINATSREYRPVGDPDHDEIRRGAHDGPIPDISYDWHRSVDE